MRIVCWNMAAGYGYDAGRHTDAWAWLNEQRADVALLQEAVVASGVADEWTSVVHTPTYATSRIPWGTAVCTRGATYTLHQASEDGWLALLGGSVCVAAPASPDGLWFVSIHSNASPVARERLQGRCLDDVPLCSDGEVWQIDLAAHDLARLLAGRRFVGGGDLNSSLLFDEVNGYRKNERLFANLAAAGFVDLRPRHSRVEQRTFFRADTTRPYQLDHIFADTATEARVASWTVLTEVAETMRLSDHAPIHVTLDESCE